MVNIRKESLFYNTVSFVIAFLVCISSFSGFVFADETITNGEWTIVNTASSGTATIKDLNFTYYSPTTVMDYGSSGGKNYVRSNNSNGSASNGIVITSGKGYCEYPAEKEGTLTVFVGNASTKTGYVSRKNNTTNKDEPVGEFVPGGSGNYNKENFEVIQGTTWATVNIEVESGYTYYICLSGSKMFCYGAEFVPYTEVKGTVYDSFNISDFGIKFTNSATEQVKLAAVDTSNKTYSIKLKPGFTYSASLTGSNATSYAFSPDTRIIKPIGEEFAANLTVEKTTTYKINGSLIGFPEGYNLDDLVLRFVPKDINDYETIIADFDKATMTYSATLVANEGYSLQKSGANDYEFKTELLVNNSDNSNVVKNVEVKAAATFLATGKFIGLTQKRGVYENLNVSPSEIIFKNLEDSYTYKANISDTGYSVNLRKGSYIASILCENYSTTTHVIIDDRAVNKDLLLKFTGKTEVFFTDTLYVGNDKDYKSVQSAVDAVSNMKRTENQRVTIKIDPGTYHEQVYITAPNITLESNGGDRNNTKITWYYGIGYKYYSSVNSLYDPYADYDKYEKGDVIKYWGAAVITEKTAEGFNAKNICFENSFNKYMTEEEISDGVEINGREAIKVERKETTKVDTRTATERAAAYVNYADKTEFLNCGFVGSQDTLYTCNVEYKAYYKNCYIEGQTDYIYGNGDVVFDGCELSWCGYNGSESGGYITAHSADASHPVDFGYVFRDCIVTGNKTRTVASGLLGRMWGKQATVNFINTQVENPLYLADSGWAEMGNPPVKPTDENVKLIEYNTTYNGEKVDISKRVAGAVDTIETGKYTVKNIFVNKGWTPNYYMGECAEIPEIVSGPSFMSNGDLNAPNPGETITLSYNLNDACSDYNVSRISWYAVDKEYDDTSLETILNSSTLLYTTASYKTVHFQLPMECAGKYFMAVVTPIVLGGKEGNPKYIIDTQKLVSDTWSNPDNIGEIAPGSGINIYLAGDSTVKDYSANGMYNDGKIQNLGSWGEFLQDFFDKDFVTVNNYAQGGRSGRIFINEGNLDKIKKNIKKGDYLFIQFGHNDCANGKAYYEDRFVPLYAKPNGTDVINGVYPTVLPTEDIKVATPDAYKSKYGDKWYSWDCGATYKGYIQAHINVALDAEAIPIIVSPVARMYYNSNGTIKTHHDSTATDYEPTISYKTSNNAYVTACKQLYDENITAGKEVYYLDGYALTEAMFKDAWKDLSNNTNGLAMMGTGGDSTHCNKTGGVIEAGLFAKWIQDANLPVSKYVIQPTTVYGENADGKYIFTIKDKIFTALDNSYKENSYVTNYGQTLFDAIGGNSLATTYTISGKTNLTNGVINLLDSNNRKVASSEIKSDGTYVIKFTTAADISKNTYNVKVDGYGANELKMTADSSSPNNYMAEDIIFEEEIIINNVSLDFSADDSLALYETSADTTFKNGVYTGVYTNDDKQIFDVSIYKVAIMYFNSTSHYGTKMDVNTPLFSFKANKAGMYTLTVTASTGSGTVDLFKSCSDVTSRGSCSESITNADVPNQNPVNIIYKKVSNEPEILYFSASKVNNLYVKSVSIKKETLPDDKFKNFKGDITGIENNDSDVIINFKGATDTKTVSISEYKENGVELIVGETYNITAVGKGYYQGTSIVTDETGKADLVFSRVIFDFPLDIGENFDDFSDYLSAMGYGTTDITDFYSGITIHPNGMVMFNSQYGAKTNAYDFISFKAKESGKCTVSVDITASNSDTVLLKVNGTTITEPVAASETVVLSTYVNKGDIVTVSTPTRSNLYYRKIDVSYESSIYEGVLGDASADDKVDVNDASLVLQKVLNNSIKLPIEEITNNYIRYVDVDNNGKLTAIDAAIILQKALNDDFVMPIEK